MVDLSVFERRKSLEDQFRERRLNALNEQFLAQKAATGGGNMPAAVKLANEIGKARQSGNTQRLNDLMASAKMMDRGLTMNAQGGYTPMQGYGDALGQIAGAKKGYEADAQNISDMHYDPQTAALSEQAKLQQQLELRPKVQAAVKEAEQGALAKATAAKELGEREATLPQLHETAQNLSRIGKDATYTNIGRARDGLLRELGVTTRGARKRAEYIANVNNQVLPLLRQTFGAAFTEREGESLKATLGDPNMSPEEKDAVLEAFINEKIGTIQSKQRELGQPVQEYPALGLGGSQSAPTLEEQFKAIKGRSNIPMGAIKHLKQNPDLADWFDEKYGSGSAEFVLGGS